MASVGRAEAKVCYSRPATRGRLVFGGLVPYDTLWRTGANEPTILHLSAPANIAGLDVDAGAYSLYTVPGLEQWMLIVNGSTSQWGLTEDAVGAGGNRFSNAYTDDVRAREVGRMPIETSYAPFTERFTAGFGEADGSTLDLHFDWATTRIIVPIRFADGP